MGYLLLYSIVMLMCQSAIGFFIIKRKSNIKRMSSQSTLPHIDFYESVGMKTENASRTGTEAISAFI